MIKKISHAIFIRVFPLKNGMYVSDNGFSLMKTA